MISSTLRPHLLSILINMLSKFNPFSKNFDCESTAVQLFMVFVIIPVGVGLPIAILSPVIEMIGGGLIDGVARSAGYVQEK